MRVAHFLAVLLVIASAAFGQAPGPTGPDCVILLHGLARTEGSMSKMEEELSEAGYEVANVGYESRHWPIPTLAVDAISRGLAACPADSPVHFVTHSLGGILVRWYLEDRTIPPLGRVVMLGPPNQGSEVVDHLRDVPGFELLNGPAGLQLGTGEQSVPRQLGPVKFDLGVIAGSSTINPILSTFLPDPDDGKVSVEATKVEGMRDHLVLPVTHPLMMRDEEVIAQVIHYLRHGSFRREPEP